MNDRPSTTLFRGSCPGCTYYVDTGGDHWVEADGDVWHAGCYDGE